MTPDNATSDSASQGSESASGRRRDLLPLVGTLLLVLVLHSPSLLRPNAAMLNDRDWLLHIANHAFARKAILELGYRLDSSTYKM